MITWSASGLPPGIAIARSSGLISGTPTLAGTYQVTVTARDNAHPPTFGYASFNWYVGNMAPIISKIVPVVSQGVGGIRVVITGRNFTDASAVDFGGINSGSLTVNRVGTRIVTFAPADTAGTVDVTVTALGGTSAAVPTDEFTYLSPRSRSSRT